MTNCILRWICVFIMVPAYVLLSQDMMTVYHPVTEKHLQPAHIRMKNEKPLVFLVAAAGDLMMGGSALSTIKSRGPDFPFDSTRAVIGSADMAVANLEAPFCTSGRAARKKYTFRVPPEFAGGIKRAGFDVLTLANNHLVDFGPDGLLCTLGVLDSLSILHCGAGRDAEQAGQAMVAEFNGWRIACLAFSLTYPSAFWAGENRPGTAYPDFRRIKNQIRTLRSEVDLVIVSFHWGQELRNTPKAYQQAYAHDVIDWGADLVIGHHPHVLQGMEIYKGRLIAYSLGNYVFGSYSRNAVESVILKIRFDHIGPLLAEVVPISVYNLQVNFQPRVRSGRARYNTLENLDALSSPLNRGKSFIQPRGFFAFPSYKERPSREIGYSFAPPVHRR